MRLTHFERTRPRKNCFRSPRSVLSRNTINSVGWTRIIRSRRQRKGNTLVLMISCLNEFLRRRHEKPKKKKRKRKKTRACRRKLTRHFLVTHFLFAFQISLSWDSSAAVIQRNFQVWVKRELRLVSCELVKKLLCFSLSLHGWWLSHSPLFHNQNVPYSWTDNNDKLVTRIENFKKKKKENAEMKLG